jgi:hypothetical protein
VSEVEARGTPEKGLTGVPAGPLLYLPWAAEKGSGRRKGVGSLFLQPVEKGIKTRIETSKRTL